MKLRDIFNTLNEMLVGVEDMNWREKDLVLSNVADYLESLGFRFLDSGCFSHAFLSEIHGGIVIKVSTICVNIPDLEEHPFLRAVWLRPLFKSTLVLIQPMAERVRLRKAQKQIQNIIQSDERNLEPWRAFDMHTGNVGWYRGRAVSFDILSNSTSTWDYFVSDENSY